MGVRIRSHAPFNAYRDATILIAGLATAGAFRDIIEEMLEATRKYLVREYKGRARREWAKIKPSTRALSRGRSGAAVTSYQQLKAQARRALPLIDTGETLRSLDRGHPLNVFNLFDMRGEVGSRSPILAKHQVTHETRFTFGPSESTALARNVPPRLTRSRSQKWNRLYFQLRGAYRKMSGKTVTVPGRPLPTEPDRATVAAMRRKIARRLADLVRQAHRNPGSRR